MAVVMLVYMCVYHWSFLITCGSILYFITCIDSSYIESSFDDDEEESLCSMNMSDPEFDEPTTDHEILQSGPFTTPLYSGAPADLTVFMSYLLLFQFFI